MHRLVPRDFVPKVFGQGHARPREPCGARRIRCLLSKLELNVICDSHGAAFDIVCGSLH
jgi:hypothetical protein